jgi:hypothetical protein
MGNKSGSGSGMNNPDHISKSLLKIFGLNYLNSLVRIRDSGWKIRIRDGKNSDPRSGINNLDPQHWTNNDLKLASSSSFFSMLFSRSRKAALNATVIILPILREKCSSDIKTFSLSRLQMMLWNNSTKIYKGGIGG